MKDKIDLWIKIFEEHIEYGKKNNTRKVMSLSVLEQKDILIILKDLKKENEESEDTINNMDFGYGIIDEYTKRIII